jgi:aryl-alcohol dehydrogenase-like predicted oxidoreductase
LPLLPQNLTRLFYKLKMIFHQNFLTLTRCLREKDFKEVNLIRYPGYRGSLLFNFPIYMLRYLSGLMKYRHLGNSTLQVSQISYGCMSLGNDQPQNIGLLRQALDHGITLFDTADLYQQGENEATVGKALSNQRQNVVIATKVGNELRPDGSGWDWNPRKEYILQAIEKSLKRLQTDYIDLYQLHGGTLDDPIDETIEAFELLRQQGKIRFYGISSIRPNVIREYVKRSNITSVMMQYSLLDRRPEEECLDLLHRQQVGVLARGSLAKGLLAGKPAADHLGHSKEEVEQAAQAVRSVAGDKRTLSETAVQFVLHHPAISSAVVGIRTHEQLEEAIRAGDAPRLVQEQAEKLQKSIPATYYEQHR